MIPKFRCWDEPYKIMRSNDEIVIWSGNVYINVKKKLDSKIKGYSRLSEHLMQSTGLKDLKGVEIFEGDVVWNIDKEEMDNGWGWFEEVKFRNGSFMVGDDFLINSHHCCVVHGNIYEQPELLGGQA